MVRAPNPDRIAAEMLDASRVFRTAAVLAGIVAAAAPSAAGASERPREDLSAPVRLAQLSAPDLVLRIDRLEEEIRRLTGLVEQLQYRNQQLEQQLRRAQAGGAGGPGPQSAPGPATQADAQARWREPDSRCAAPGAAMPPQAPAAEPLPATPVPSASSVPSASPPPTPRDVFDPTQNPNAPGAPRTLGTLSEAGGRPPLGAPTTEPPDVGVPGGRPAGAPLDLSSLSGQAGQEPPAVPGPALPSAAVAAPNGALPPPRNPGGSGTQTVMAPSATPRDEYDLAYGYVLHKDYALAEDSFRTFLKKYPGDRLVPEANYWLGEALFQRQRYRDAAESFLTVSTKYETASKAPDALLRLGQSLAALGEKDAACATLNEVGRKYPRASVVLKQGVEREQKRAGC
jgi:tol-pal system protein YbgF